MSEQPRARVYAELTAPEVSARLSAGSVLCLPIGSTEQHGPHLPLNTDTVIAEQFTQRLVDHYGDRHDLWALPAFTYGLSLEHAWSPGTVSLNTATLSALLHTVVGQYVDAAAARRILIVNGHGGNRGILEALAHELQQAYEIAVCVMHPGSLSTETASAELPEVHAGVLETSVMLALAPDAVRLDRIPADHTPVSRQREQIDLRVLRRGATWPWSSGDSAIATLGIIGGDPRKADAAIGHRIIKNAVDAGNDVLSHLTSTSVSGTYGRKHDAHL